MRVSKVAIAAAAGSFFMSSFLHVPTARAADQDQHKCEGVNSCKGKGSCKTALNDCKGKNGCAGKGFLMMTPAECAKAKAEAAKSGEKK